MCSSDKICSDGGICVCIDGRSEECSNLGKQKQNNTSTDDSKCVLNLQSYLFFKSFKDTLIERDTRLKFLTEDATQRVTAKICLTLSRSKVRWKNSGTC